MRFKALIWILVMILISGYVSATHNLDYSYRFYGRGYDAVVRGYGEGFYGTHILGLGGYRYYPGYVYRLSPSYGYTSYYPYYGYRYNPYLTDPYRHSYYSYDLRPYWGY